MIETLIISDTLTGAAEAGAKFSSAGPVKLTDLEGGDWTEVNGALAIDTHTRDQSPADINGRLSRIRTRLKGIQPSLIFKSVDSYLRGFAGLEAAALVESLDLDFALVVPACPEADITTLQGVHLFDNRLIHTTEVAKDHQRPLQDSRLKVVLAHDHDLPVELMEIELVRKGPKAVEERLRALLSRGRKFILACDSELDSDIQTLALAVMGMTDRVLLSGSASLASILAELHAGCQHSWLDDEYHSPTPKLPVIFFGGSSSNALRRQFENLSADHEGQLVEIDLDALFGSPGQTIPVISQTRPLILTLPASDAIDEKRPLPEIVRRLGLLASDLIKNRQYVTIFFSGGDLADQTIKRLGLEELWIHSEPLPGVVYSSSGSWSILTKAADSGGPETLSDLYSELISEADWRPKR
jgi:uncharacterized protein YgbK (DUF1537 family)